jgi:tRNA(Ile)-lysidine synthase
MIPSLEQYQPRMIEILAQTADILREDHEYLEAVSQEWLSKHERAEKGGLMEIDVPELLELPPALGKRVIRQCVKRMGEGLSGITWRHVNAVHGLASGKKSQGTVRLPRKLVVRRIYDRLSFKKGPPRKAPDCFHILQGPGRFGIHELSCTLLIEEISGRPSSVREGTPWTAYFDAGKMSFPLVLRTFRPGDRFVPLGMQGHKKVKDFYIDRKIPAEVRSRLPILLSGEKILWICGMMIDERVRVSGSTAKVLKATLHGVPDIEGMTS